ncbi:MAG: septum formation initiator family protein [Eubacteriaceae bacterium]|nr:septum formation initiator family protein [Eubacteriaceae bacterium]
MNNTIDYHSVATPGKIRLRNTFRNLATKFSFANISITHITMLLMAVFFATAITLCTLHLQVFQLNNEIASLEKEYANILTVNDELSGRILAQSNLGELEKYATEQLGMRKPTAGDYEYISYGPAVSEEVVTEDGGFFEDILEFFGF